MAQYSGSFTLQQQMQAQAASNWPLPPLPTFEVLVVAGGGGGAGTWEASGGGAGG